MHRLIVTALLAVTTVGAFFLAPPAQAVVDKDCGDFASQSAAQSFFLAAGPGDPHQLDAEGDGLACESNPCPCSGTVAPLMAQPTSTSSPTQATTATTNPDGSGNSGPVQRHRGNVVRITDGDTLKVRIRGVGVRSVRILGIDTPEVYGARECGGDAATTHLERLAPVGSTVRLVSDPTQADRDRYGRWLRYVERGRKDLGREQVRKGLARTYIYRNDPFSRSRAYLRVEAAARGGMRGSWQACW
ncbi:thermonuclease family protein [Nocardioides piscis]|uniref:Thermonuclease family protein n=1 Tax=Nocardioides piscis TaxID=2714938 RepID=A0A6G7YGV8_9ACTN|nr:thermonuclease family protein [Nocardioides piscis]QIK76033.1 thermonuclease family protein [Nocardioides piscis]